MFGMRKYKDNEKNKLIKLRMDEMYSHKTSKLNETIFKKEEIHEEFKHV